ncbi:MAG TPA: dethiobiotin synthase [Burkholderiales bacterium]|nr:dethiobiotin synthase [Burkholderiales bacterium]
MTPRVARSPSRGFFVTGTDTGVGKTLACCALLCGFSALGKSVIGMKPVACGAARGAQGLINADVAQLRAAANVDAPLALVNPYCFEPPIAPHVAAAQAGVAIDLGHIVHAYKQLAAAADVVIVEGVGGFCVPLNHSDDSADLAEYLRLPVILVVGVRLGCLNHALLTAQAIRARKLTLAGWIANRIDPTMQVAKQNITVLTERLAAPLLGEIDFAAAPDSQRVSALLDLSRLC